MPSETGSPWRLSVLSSISRRKAISLLLYSTRAVTTSANGVNKRGSLMMLGTKRIVVPCALSQATSSKLFGNAPSTFSPFMTLRSPGAFARRE